MPDTTRFHAHTIADKPTNVAKSDLILARVSTGSRKELLEHVDTALTPHLDRPEVRTIYRLAQQPHMLSKGTVGQDARAKHGWDTIYAPGTNRELGVLARAGNLLVLFINASASQRDLGTDQNSFIQVVEQIVLSPRFRGRNPHATPADRPHIYGPYTDRFLRDHELGWRLFNLSRQAFAVFKIAGKDPLDTLSGDAEDRWLFYAWEGSGNKKTTVTRLADGVLNLARAGRHPGQQNHLLRGFRWEHELTAKGRWRTAAECTDKSVIAHVPEPDPEAWWQVQTLVRVGLDPKITTWKALAIALGKAGFTSRGADEDGEPLHQLSDLASAAKLIMAPDNLDAYLTGRWRYTQVGPGFGIWTLPGGHRFTPRWDGDDRGCIEYTINVGTPEWPLGYTADEITTLKSKWWPDGQAKPEPPTKKSSCQARRPLASVIRWSDGNRRHEVFAHSGRYELRYQDLATAPRGKDGRLRDQRYRDSHLAASWSAAELASHIADFIDDGITKVLTDHPDARLATPVVTRAPASTQDSDKARTATKLAQLTAQADDMAAQAEGASRLANLMAVDNPQGALRKQQEADQLTEMANQLRNQVTNLAQPQPPAATSHGLLNIDTPAALVELLKSPHGVGAQPVTFNQALEQYLGHGDNLKILPIPGDRLQMQMTGNVHVRFEDGRAVHTPVSRTIPAKVAGTDGDMRIADVADLYLRQGKTLAQTAELARSRDATVLRRQLLDYIGAGQRRPNPDARTRKAAPFTAAGARIPDPGLRGAAVDAVPEVRAVIITAQHGQKPPADLPAGFAAHVLATYIPGENPGPAYRPWRGPYARKQADRYRAIAVLSSDDRLRYGGMRTDHLAACLGVDVRTINQISKLWNVNGRQDPATLARTGAWSTGGRRDDAPEDKLVSLIHCSHKRRGGSGSCPGLVTAVLFTPEVIATGSGALCDTCGRPPTSKQQFPAGHLALARERLEEHQGRWQRCGYARCTLDFGVGPGLMWAWEGHQGPVWHGPDCAARRTTPATLAPRLKPCQNPSCQHDEGYGPGIIADTGKASRRWHNPDCQRQARHRHRVRISQQLPPHPCAYEGCQVDEGAGPGVLAPRIAPGGPRRWHSRDCKRAAQRAASGLPTRGKVTWIDCGFNGCTIDEGGGPGKVRVVAGSTGHPKRHHSPRCAKAARAERTT